MNPVEIVSFVFTVACFFAVSWILDKQKEQIEKWDHAFDDWIKRLERLTYERFN